MVFLNSLMVNFLDFAVVAYQSLAKVSVDLSIQFSIDYGLRLAMEDLYALLIPIYVMVPYVLEPMATILLPYWVGIFRVKGDHRITLEHSERLLRSEDMDVVNTPYNDLVCITSSFMLVFFAPTNLHIQLFAMLAFFAGFTYVIARKRLLHWSSCTRIGDMSLHRAVSYLWSLPLALLAANVGSRVMPGETAKLGSGTVFSWGLGFFVGHVLLHILFVRFAVPATGQVGWLPDYTYSEALKLSKGASYLNTNPVEVLKSQDNILADRLTYYCQGKEYLQADSGRHYDRANGKVYSISHFLDEFMPSFCRKQSVASPEICVN